MASPKKQSFTDFIVDTLNGNTPGRWEVDCKRELSASEFARYGSIGETIYHRYGWPGGYTFQELLQRSLMRGNPLLRKLKESRRVR